MTNKRKRGRPRTRKPNSTVKASNEKNNSQDEYDHTKDGSDENATHIFESSDDDIENSSASNSQNLTNKRKQRKSKAYQLESEKTKKIKKKMNNNDRMKNLDNPHIESITSNHNFIITIPSTKSHITDIYDPKKYDQTNWEIFNVEQIFIGEKDDDEKTKEEEETKEEETIEEEETKEEDEETRENDDVEVGEEEEHEQNYNQSKSKEEEDDEDEENDDVEVGEEEEHEQNYNQSKSKEEDDDEDEENEVEIVSLEKHEPFTKYSTIRSFVSNINKGYRIIRIDTNDPEFLAFRCSSTTCSYRIEFRLKEDGFYVSHKVDHSCPNRIIIDKEVLRDVVEKHGKSTSLNKEYFKTINKSLGLNSNPLYNQRIRNAYKHVFKLTKKQRLESWMKLSSFIDIIIETGGYGSIHRNEDGLIDFVGMVPNYSVRFINSDVFFPVCQLDSRFQTAISKGHLYELVTITGNRTIIPIAIAWAITENKKYTEMLLELLKKELHLIKSCHTDNAGALITPIEQADITNILCTWHMSKHCPSRETFKSLVKSQTSQEYARIKQRIIAHHKNLKRYLDKNNKWQKISRFEKKAPRDLNIASTAAESFNAYIKNNELKDKEPFEVFLAAYDFGFFALKNLCDQNGPLTDAIDNWLSYALPVAANLSVNNTSFQCKFEVTKDDDEKTKCTVIILNSEKPQCTCRFYYDCGMPCVHLLAVALKLEIDWGLWIHPRYIVSNYRFLFHHLEYPDFNKAIINTNDRPAIIDSMKKSQKRIETPGNITHHKSKK